MEVSKGYKTRGGCLFSALEEAGKRKWVEFRAARNFWVLVGQRVSSDQLASVT